MARRGDAGRRRSPTRRRRPGPKHEVIYGRNAVAEVLGGRRRCVRLLVQDGLTNRERIDALIRTATARSVPVSLVNLRVLDETTRGGNHQGIALEAEPYIYVQLDDLLRDARGRTMLLLDRLQDPQNLATLIRTAAAVDAAGVIIQSDRSASVTPAVVHASAGLVERIAIARVTNAGRAIETCKDAGYWAIVVESTPDAEEIFAADLPTPALLIVGSEGAGVSVPARRAADVAVRLPMPGGVESLNAAVAGSVALYELVRRADSGRSKTGERETSH